MKQKLQELAKYCCEPKSEAEFLAVKLAAEKGGLVWYDENKFSDSFHYLGYCEYECKVISFLMPLSKPIPVHEYCEMLLKDESEFDRRVSLVENESPWYYSPNFTSMITHKGYHWETNEDKTEVLLIKD